VCTTYVREGVRCAVCVRERELCAFVVMQSKTGGSAVHTRLRKCPVQKNCADNDELPNHKNNRSENKAHQPENSIGMRVHLSWRVVPFYQMTIRIVDYVNSEVCEGLVDGVDEYEDVHEELLGFVCVCGDRPKSRGPQTRRVHTYTLLRLDTPIPQEPTHSHPHRGLHIH
jgi:hypothetical protein